MQCSLIINIVILDYKELKLDRKRMEHFETICEVLKDYLSDTILPNPVELLGIYGRVSSFLFSSTRTLTLLIYHPNVFDLFRYRCASTVSVLSTGKCRR